PFAKVYDFRKTGLRVGELSFVNDEAGISTTLSYRLKDFVEWHDDVFEFAEIKLQREKRTGHRPRHCDYAGALLLWNVFVRWSMFEVRCPTSGNKKRPIAISHVRPAGQQQMFIRDVSIRMDRNRRNVQLAA